MGQNRQPSNIFKIIKKIEISGDAQETTGAAAAGAASAQHTVTYFSRDASQTGPGPWTTFLFATKYCEWREHSSREYYLIIGKQATQPFIVLRIRHTRTHKMNRSADADATSVAAAAALPSPSLAMCRN